MKPHYKYILGRIEVLGNKIPHPFWIFNILSAIVVLLSKIFEGALIRRSLTEVHTEYVYNILNGKYLLTILSELDQIFISYRPLSIVLLVLMGVSVFQGSGAISAIIRSSSRRIPTSLLIAFAAFIAINGNMVSDVSIILVPTLMAALFQSMNIHPWLGIIVGFAASNGAWSLNMFIAGTDAIISEISTYALEQNGIIHKVNPFSNWIFMFFGSILVLFLTVFVAERITKKALGIHDMNVGVPDPVTYQLSSGERRGMKYLKVFVLAFFVLIFLLSQMPNGDIHLGKSGSSFLMENITGLIFLFLMFAGLSFGLGSGSIRNLNDLPDILSGGISASSVFIVTAFPAAIFLRLLNDSHIGLWIGSSLSYFLTTLHFPPLIILILFIVLVALLNLILVSGSVKWMFLAPILLPVFSQLDIKPEVAQLAYRIGDSVTNCITPADVYLSVIINLLILYKTENDTKVGIGTVISMTLPYTLAYFMGLTILFCVFYLLNIRVGL